MRLVIKVTPNSKRSEFIGFSAGAFKLKLKAPPVDGKANKALVEFLADYFQIKKSEISIIHGETSRDKVVELPDKIEAQLIELRQG